MAIPESVNPPASLKVTVTFPLGGTTTLYQTSPPEKLAQVGLIPESEAPSLVPVVLTQDEFTVIGIALAQSSLVATGGSVTQILKLPNELFPHSHTAI